MCNHFDILAPVYDRIVDPLLGPPDSELWRKLLDLPVDGRLLDAGGGTGRVSGPLRPMVRQLVVCDISLGMLRRTRGRGGIDAVRADVARLPFPDAGFERIMVSDALHHFRHQQKVIRELARVLAPGGILVIEEFDIRHHAVKALAMLEKLTLMGSRFIRLKEILGMIAEMDLIAEIREGKKFSVLIVVRKKILDPHYARR